MGDDPVTMTMAAATAASTAGSVFGGMQAQGAADARAAAYQQQAHEETVAAGSQIAGNDYRANQRIGRDVATAGASGVTPDSFTPVVSEDFAEAKIRDAYARYHGQLAANSDLYAAKLSKYQGSQAMMGGILGGAENVLGGLTDIGKSRMSRGLGWSWSSLGIGAGGTP